MMFELTASALLVAAALPGVRQGSPVPPEDAPRGGRPAWLGPVVGIVAIAALVIGIRGGAVTGPMMPGHMSSSATGMAAPAIEGAPTMDLVATDLAFDRETLTVTAGVPFNISLVNEGRVFHDLSIAELDFMLDANAGQQVAGSLVVEQPGTYVFECSVPGHANAGMRGTLVVEAARSTTDGGA